MSWVKTGGSDALFSINPAGVPVPEGGFILRSMRAAQGGAGTTATITGLSSGGLPCVISCNMAQWFFSVTDEVDRDVVRGFDYRFTGRCTYGSGTTREAYLWQTIEGYPPNMIASTSGGTSGANLVYEAGFTVTAPQVDSKYYIEFVDAFGRRYNTPEITWHAIATPTRVWAELDGVELYPGVNPNIASGRISAREVKAYNLRIRSTPETVRADGSGYTTTTDAAFNNTRMTIAQPTASDSRDLALTYPSNAAAGSGGINIWMDGIRVFLVEASAIVPARPALAEVRPGAPTTGVTVTRVNATNWNVSLPLSGGAKSINAVEWPTNAGITLTQMDTEGDNTIATVGITNNVSWLVTPRKVGTTNIKLRVINYSGDPTVYVTLKVTVT